MTRNINLYSQMPKFETLLPSSASSSFDHILFKRFGPMNQWTNEPMDQWTNGPMDHGNWQHWQFSILIIDNDMHQISKWMKSFVIVHVKTYIDGHTICGYPHTNMGTHKLYWVPTIRYIYDIEFLSCASIFLTIKVCIHYIIYFFYQVNSKRCKWQSTVGNWRWQLTVNN